MSDVPRTRRERSSATDVVAGQPSMITTTPVSWSSAAPSAAPAAMAGQIGWSSARPSLDAMSGPIRPLEISGSVLPELEEESSAAKRRPLWLHPAFLVSAGTTLIALIALAVFVVLGVFGGKDVAADLQIESTENVVRASWSGPDVPYQVIVIDGPAGDAVDVSQRVTGTELWLPLAAGLIDERSCLLVRPAEGNEKASTSLDRTALDQQGAVAGCVTDAEDEE
ncbi:hypothetical protein [Microbacterium murale]|uniref:Uncharacterized protein n=1 Tax=Microbacterium murale TaxID=1081040 RepID=A0ABU0PAX6_9MICO|nr:hypothetical protein [Microbacterium murale]MDQ0644062.1 hypothetical protein [Microbacterium murale]